jgi:hypothetical protein
LQFKAFEFIFQARTSLFSFSFSISLTLSPQFFQAPALIFRVIDGVFTDDVSGLGEEHPNV